MNPGSESYLERELALLSSGQDELARYFARTYPAEAGLASNFARLYPERAGQLERDPHQPPDPHAERLIQGFAFLAGRVHHKIDEEFPQLTEALLAVLYPHLLLPVPALAMAQYTADPSTPAAWPVRCARESRLATRPVGQPPTSCQWRTGYPVELWPVQVSQTSLKPAAYFSGLSLPVETAAVLQLQLECSPGQRFADLPLDHLRFYLHGDRQSIATLYELLFNHTLKVLLRDPDAPGRDFPITLQPAECLAPVGFELDEGLIPFPCESFAGYRLLTEFFSFPNKFTFVDLKGLDRACRAGFGRRLQVVFLLNRGDEELARAVEPSMFQLGCTPLVNLFPKIADPIALTHTRYEYKVIPDRASPQAVEVYSVDTVSTFEPDQGTIQEYQPFYSFRFDQDRDTQRAFWYASRRPSRRARSHATETYLVLVDRKFNPHRPAEEAISIHLTCHNGDLPAQVLRPGHPLTWTDGTFAGAIQLLVAPTPPRRPPLRKATFWRWLSQHALGQIPLSDAEDGLDALQETLLLCAFAQPSPSLKQQSAILRQLIEGITALESRRVVRPVAAGGRVCLCRGVEFTLELDRPKYAGTGAFLFASVLERFLGLYANVNSFSQLLVRLKQGKGFLKKWPPRAADRPLG